MKRIKKILFKALLIFFCGTPISYAQTLPKLTNIDLKVDVTLSGGNFTYLYTIVSGPENIGELDIFEMDIKSIATPTGITTLSHYAPEGWEVAIARQRSVLWHPLYRVTGILPGTNLSGFKLQTNSPPGPRTFIISPVLPIGEGFFPEDCEIRPDCPKPWEFDIRGQTIGPVLADELVLIDGKGQRPTDVNTFLKYSNPTQTRTTLPAGTKKFDLVVFYGPTIVPNTFSVSLNGVIITPKFAVTPGGLSVVRLDLANGSNTLILSVEGIRSDGQKGRDTDRLTFIVP